jgi:hypothetical protein
MSNKKKASQKKRAKAPTFIPPTQRRKRDWDKAIKYLDPRAFARFLQRATRSNPEIVASWRASQKVARFSPRANANMGKYRKLFAGIAACREWMSSARRKHKNAMQAKEAAKGYDKKKKVFRFGYWENVRERNATTADTADLIISLLLLGFVSAMKRKPYSPKPWRLHARILRLLLAEVRPGDDIATTHETAFILVRDRLRHLKDVYDLKWPDVEAAACWTAVERQMASGHIYVSKAAPKGPQSST